MKSLLVVLSVIGLGAAQHWGQAGVPQDTPEVAAAKAAHLAALARVSAPQQQQHWNQGQQQWNQGQQWNQQPQQSWNPPQKPWTGPLALPPGFDSNGAPLPVQDTPEVQAERARHFTLYSSGNHITQLPAAAPSWNQAPAQQSWNQNQQWNHPPAQPAWNPNQNYNQAPSWNSNQQAGLPVDTPEVAAAKAAHFAAHSQLGTNNRWGHH
ncbi:pupal cuticle protein-like [Cimex lectularius]|uniref:CPR type cuticle protein n=1 Tax=Cimex lectularius TaxID=79782 RepID=A0A8I6S5H4_CIMLE|nr:pupal cuticle protein-like [Cimex lectularius]